MDKYSVYSLADVVVTINHEDVGQCVISDEGGGRVVITRSGDLSNHTVTATGYVVVNKLRSVNGTVALELPQNSPADAYMRKLIKHLISAATDKFAISKMTVNDPAGGKVITLTGLTPQKWPDENYDQTSSTRNYTWLAANIAET